MTSMSMSTPLSSISASSFLKSSTNRSFSLNLSSHKKISIFCNLFENNDNNKEHRFQNRASFINNPEPPWKLWSKKMEEDSSFSSMKTIHGSEFPVSLRIIKMKQKLVSNSTETIPSSLDSSIIKSISSVLLMIEELLKYKGNSTEDPIIVSREMSDSFVLLFKKVFFNSPNLYLGVMDLITELIVFSAQKYSPKKLLDYENENGDLSDFERRRIIYESLVFDDPENSLILSNYAQFLYQIANDYDKAEELFKRAVQVKPVDGDALSKYGIFLWKKRGDMEAAEEAFLAAIDAEPQNSYHESKYAWFLWETGGSDICFPLKPSV